MLILALANRVAITILLGHLLAAFLLLFTGKEYSATILLDYSTAGLGGATKQHVGITRRELHFGSPIRFFARTTVCVCIVHICVRVCVHDWWKRPCFVFSCRPVCGQLWHHGKSYAVGWQPKLATVHLKLCIITSWSQHREQSSLEQFMPGSQRHSNSVLFSVASLVQLGCSILRHSNHWKIFNK